jgi:hypothetical protein
MDFKQKTENDAKRKKHDANHIFGVCVCVDDAKCPIGQRHGAFCEWKAECFASFVVVF